MSAQLRLVPLLGLLALTACLPAPDRAQGYGTRAPRHAPELDDVPVTGHRVWVRFDDGRRLKGELLSAETDGEVVVRTKRDGDQHGAFADVRRATVQIDRHAAGWMVGIGSATALFVPLSIAAAGLWSFVLTPIVGAGGSIALLVVWAESRVVLRDDDLGYLYQYARWPQGWPEQPSSGVGTPIGPESGTEPAPAPEPESAPAPLPIEPTPLTR